ncbi:hypothetical protein DFH07DRAFT_948176 [Mycena maculata]|uniref:DUF6532 domain-containing protein n=1 Tax=Mycena maculata TaxID=230809 RepID=A0AAD7KGG7_9AGAR|nr:hypothetical protein DFH07DRAFT_948176 [Mycena maculata]
MSHPVELSAIEKRAQTKIRKALEQADEERRLIAAGAGVRLAKDTAMKNAGKSESIRRAMPLIVRVSVWKPASSTGRKRAPSPTQDPPTKTKKARANVPPAKLDQDFEEEAEDPPKRSTRSSSSRKHPPATIEESDDDVQAPKSRKARAMASKPSKPTKQSKPTVKKTRPSLTAESASEDSSDSDSSAESSEAEDDDEDDEDTAAKHQPRIVKARSPSPHESNMPDFETHMQPAVEAMEDGLSSDDSVRIPSPGHRRTTSTSSVTSWSSGPGNPVPETDDDMFGDAGDVDEDYEYDETQKPQKIQDSDSSEEDRPVVTPAPKIKMKLPQKIQDSDDEDQKSAPPAKPQKNKGSDDERPASPAVKVKHKPPQKIQDSDDEEQPAPPATRIKKKLRKDQDSDDERPAAPAVKFKQRPLKKIPTSDDERPAAPAAIKKTSTGPKAKTKASTETIQPPGVDQFEAEERKKTPKGKSVREQKADQEKPRIRGTPAVELNSKKPRASTKVPEGVNLPEESFHASARIVFPGHGKDIKKSDQTAEVQMLIDGAITIIKTHCILVEGYPVLHSRTGYAKTNMLKAGRGKSEAIHVVKRLESDPRMARWLGNIVVDRLSTVRSEAKKRANTMVPGIYRFAHLEPASVKVFVGNLLDGDKGCRILRGHPAILKMIREEWFTGKFVGRNAKYFKASRPKYPDQWEVPDAVLALAANTIYAALSEYQLTGTRQQIKFTESAYEDSYRSHLATLADTRANAPTATAALLHEIYVDVIGAGPTTVAATTSTVITIIEVPDSD